MLNKKNFYNLLYRFTSLKDVTEIIKTLQQILQYVQNEMIGDTSKWTISHVQRMYGALLKLQVINEDTLEVWLPLVHTLVENKLPQKIFLQYYIQKVFSFFLTFQNLKEQKTKIDTSLAILLKLCDGILHYTEHKLDLSQEYQNFFSFVKHLEINNSNDLFPSACNVLSKYIIFFPKEEIIKDSFHWIGLAMNNLATDKTENHFSGKLVLEALIIVLPELTNEQIVSLEQNYKINFKEDRLKKLLKPRSVDIKNEWAHLMKIFIELAKNPLRNSSVFINIVTFTLLHNFDCSGEEELKLTFKCWLRSLPFLITNPNINTKKRNHILEIIFKNTSYIMKPDLIKLQLNSIWSLIKIYQFYDKDYTEILQDFLLKMFGSHIPKKGKDLNINRNKTLCIQEYCNDLAQYLSRILDPEPGYSKRFLWNIVPQTTKAILTQTHIIRLTPQIIHSVLVILETMESKENDDFEIQDFICASLITHLSNEKIIKVYPDGLKKLFRSIITLQQKCKDKPKIRLILLKSIIKRIIEHIPTKYLFSPSYSLINHQVLAIPVHFFLEILFSNSFIEFPEAKTLIENLINLHSDIEHCQDLVSTLTRIFSQDIEGNQSLSSDSFIINMWKKLPELLNEHKFQSEIPKNSSIDILSIPLQILNSIPPDEQNNVIDTWQDYLLINLKTHTDSFIFEFFERLISINPWTHRKIENIELFTNFLMVVFETYISYSGNQTKILSNKDLKILIQILERSMKSNFLKSDNSKLYQLIFDRLCKCLSILIEIIDQKKLSLVCNSFGTFITESLIHASNGPLLLLWTKFFIFLENGVKEIITSDCIYSISEFCQRAFNCDNLEIAMKTKKFYEEILLKNFSNNNYITSIKIPVILLDTEKTISNTAYINSDKSNASPNKIKKEVMDDLPLNDISENNEENDCIPSSQPSLVQSPSVSRRRIISTDITPTKRLLRTPKPKEYSDYEIFPSYKKSREKKMSSNESANELNKIKKNINNKQQKGSKQNKKANVSGIQEEKLKNINIENKNEPEDKIDEVKNKKNDKKKLENKKQMSNSEDKTNKVLSRKNEIKNLPIENEFEDKINEVANTKHENKNSQKEDMPKSEDKTNLVQVNKKENNFILNEKESNDKINKNSQNNDNKSLSEKKNLQKKDESKLKTNKIYDDKNENKIILGEKEKDDKLNEKKSLQNKIDLSKSKNKTNIIHENKESDVKINENKLQNKENILKSENKNLLNEKKSEDEIGEIQDGKFKLDDLQNKDNISKPEDISNIDKQDQNENNIELNENEFVDKINETKNLQNENKFEDKINEVQDGKSKFIDLQNQNENSKSEDNSNIDQDDKLENKILFNEKESENNSNIIQDKIQENKIVADEKEPEVEINKLQNRKSKFNHDILNDGVNSNKDHDDKSKNKNSQNINNKSTSESQIKFKFQAVRAEPNKKMENNIIQKNEDLTKSNTENNYFVEITHLNLLEELEDERNTNLENNIKTKISDSNSKDDTSSPPLEEKKIKQKNINLSSKDNKIVENLKEIEFIPLTESLNEIDNLEKNISDDLKKVTLENNCYKSKDNENTNIDKQQKKEEILQEPLENIKIQNSPSLSITKKEDSKQKYSSLVSINRTASFRSALMVAMSKNSPLPEASTILDQREIKQSPKPNRLIVGYKSPRAAKMLEMAKEQDGSKDSYELEQMEILNHSFETIDQREETPPVPIKKSRRTRRFIPKSGRILKNISPQIKKLIISDKDSEIKLNYVDWNPPPSPHPDVVPQRSALRQSKTNTPSKGVHFLKSEVSNLLVFTYSDLNDSKARFEEVLEDSKYRYKDCNDEENTTSETEDMNENPEGVLVIKEELNLNESEDELNDDIDMDSTPITLPNPLIIKTELQGQEETIEASKESTKEIIQFKQGEVKSKKKLNMSKVDIDSPRATRQSNRLTRSSTSLPSPIKKNSNKKVTNKSSKPNTQEKNLDEESNDKNINISKKEQRREEAEEEEEEDDEDENTDTLNCIINEIMEEIMEDNSEQTSNNLNSKIISNDNSLQGKTPINKKIINLNKKTIKDNDNQDNPKRSNINNETSTISNKKSNEDNQNQIKKRKRGKLVEEQNEEILPVMKRQKRTIKEYFNKSDKIDKSNTDLSTAETSKPITSNNEKKIKEITLPVNQELNENNENKTRTLRKRKVDSPLQDNISIVPEGSIASTSSPPKQKKDDSQLNSKEISKKNLTNYMNNETTEMNSTKSANKNTEQTTKSENKNPEQTTKSDNKNTEQTPKSDNKNIEPTTNSLEGEVVLDENEIELEIVNVEQNNSQNDPLCLSNETDDDVVLLENQDSFSWINTPPRFLLYKKLKNSPEPIEAIIPRLFSPIGPIDHRKIARLSCDLKLSPLKTVGDFASLPISEVRKLNLPRPRVLLALHTLKCFEKMPNFKIPEMEMILKKMRALPKSNRIHLMADLITDYPEVAFDYIEPYTLYKNLPNILTAPEALIPFITQNLKRNKDHHLRFILPILHVLIKKYENKTILNALIMAYKKEDIINHFDNNDLIKQIRNQENTQNPDSSSNEIELNSSTSSGKSIPEPEQSQLPPTPAIIVKQTSDQSTCTEQNFYLNVLNSHTFLEETKNFNLEQFQQVQINLIKLLSLTQDSILTLTTKK